MTGPDVRIHVAVGVYREVQRPMRRVFTWEWEDSTNRVGGTVVTVEFKDAGGDRTELVSDPRALRG